MRHPRLGALSLGNVDYGDQHGRDIAMRDRTGIDRNIDQRRVGLEVPPGTSDIAFRR